MNVMIDEQMEEEYEFIVEQIDEIPFEHADKDAKAVEVLQSRIARTCTGSFKKTITFSELFSGVELHLSSGDTYEVDFSDDASEEDIGISTHDFNSKIITDYLNYISLQTFKDGLFLASVVVVYAKTFPYKKKGTPGWGFYELANQISLLADDATAHDKEEFRKSQADKATAYYKKKAKEQRQKQEATRVNTKRIPPRESF